MTEKKLSNLSIACFWHRPDGQIIPLYQSVGIERVIQEEKESRVFFKIRPNGIEFVGHMRDMGTLVEVRYSVSPADNPMSGEPLVSISHIVPYYVGIEFLNPVETPPKELFFDVRARCRLTWTVVPSPVHGEDYGEFEGFPEF